MMIEKQCLKCEKAGTMIEEGIGLVVVCWGNKTRKQQIDMFLKDKKCKDRVVND